MQSTTYAALIRVGEFEIALPADQVREVISHPGALSLLPDAGGCMDGTLSLRGQCVPVINLMRLLNVEATAARFIAVTRCNGKVLGLAIHDILKVGPVLSDAQFEMAGGGRTRSRLFSRCFHDGQNGRLIHLLDLEALHSFDEVRTAAEPQKLKIEEKATSKEPLLHLALFNVGGRNFGVDRRFIWKALPAKQITERVSDMGLLRGYLMDNNIAIPVLDLLGLLQVPATTERNSLSQGIILQQGERKVGFEIDQVIGSTVTTESNLAPIGGTSSLGVTQLTRSGCRVLNTKDYGLIVVLDLAALLQGEELRNATANQRRPVAGQVRRQETDLKSGPAISFVTYHVGTSRFCTPLIEVEAIIPLPEFLSLSSTGHYFRGVMEWRNRVVNLFDLGVLLAAREDETSSEKRSTGRRVLIVRSPGQLGTEFRGYLVDEVEALTSAAPEPIPSLVTNSWAARGGPACPSITEMIQIGGATESRSNVNVLHLAQCEAAVPATPLALTA